MNTQLKAHLQIAIQKWMEDHCEEDIWPQGGITGERTVLLMTDAAEAVLDAVMEVQEYGTRQGFFVEPEW
jgi:hypothetical protein